MKRIASFVVLILIALVFAGCGGSPQSQPGTKQSQPLDPQGNWLFVFTGNSGATMNIAGFLQETNPPTVTSEPMASTPDSQVVCDSLLFNGQASGTNSITLTAQALNPSPHGQVEYTLTGTIAPDQAHMSGTWVTTTSGLCLGDAGGTWTAQLLTPVTGTWTGTVSSGTGDLSMTAALTEDTDQSSPTDSQVSGTITVLGSPCFPSNETFTIPAMKAGAAPGFHIGESLFIFTTEPDANGVLLGAFNGSGPAALFGVVPPDASSFTGTISVHGGACDGQTFTGQITHQ